jgi:hypothetical protein
MRLRPAFEAVYTPIPPFDFEKTVRKPAGWSLFTPFEAWEGGVLWTSAFLGGRLFGLRLHSTGSLGRPGFRVRVYASGTLGAGERRSVRGLLGSKLAVDQDLGSFYRLARRDPILRYPARRLRGMRSTGPAHLFADVVLALSLHMAPMKRSEEMMECFIERYGGHAEFEGRDIPAWPTAGAAAEVPERSLRRRCGMGFRAKYVHACARLMSRGFPETEDLARLAPEEARAKLLELPGIGEYSADILNPHGGFPIDSWTAEVFGLLFKGKVPRNGREAIPRIKAEGLRRWGGMAWLAFFYVVQDLPDLAEKLGLPLRPY